MDVSVANITLLLTFARYSLLYFILQAHYKYISSSSFHDYYEVPIIITLSIWGADIDLRRFIKNMNMITKE